MSNLINAIDNTVSFSDFNKGQAGKIFDRVKKTGAKIVMKNNKPECILLSPEEYAEMIDNFNDLELLLDAVQRTSKYDKSDLFTQEEVDKIFGFNSIDLDDDEIEIE